jgi:hypothetical protein
MKWLRVALAALTLFPLTVKADDTRLSKDTRQKLIGAFSSELVYAHTTFPMGLKGLTIKDGKIDPDARQVALEVANNGAACKPGDTVNITKVEFFKDRIRFEINGGPVKKQSWKQRVRIGGSGGEVPLAPTDPRTINSQGSYVELVFAEGYVPEITVEQIKAKLAPAIDFTHKSPMEAYLDTIPPKAQEAIKTHKCLVGMTADMVFYAKGKPDQKVREQENEGEGDWYEEWVYGVIPADVTFVRFKRNQVVQIRIARFGQGIEVRNEKEVDVPNPLDELEKPKEKPPNAPTLKRPGEN